MTDKASGDIARHLQVRGRSLQIRWTKGGGSMQFDLAKRRRGALRFKLTLVLFVVATAVCLVSASAAPARPQDSFWQAKAIVAQAEKPVPGPPVPALNAASVKLKKIWFVSFALSIPYSQQVWSGVQEAAKALGAH